MIDTARGGLPVNVTEDRPSSCSSVTSCYAPATGYTTSQRPDRAPGVSLTPPGGRNLHQWINPAAFTLVTNSSYDNAPRNIDRAQLLFRSEFFNIFNRAQCGQPVADRSASTFGQIISTLNTGPTGTGTPRQIQFMLRLEF